jgi:hypothetical protein
MNHDQTSTQRGSEPTGTDAPYTFGRPASTYLAQREIVRLTILRSKVREARLQFEATAISETAPAAE